MTTQPGTLIANRFRIDRSLGKGGYGEVWEATQLSVDRKVAVKLLTPSAQAHDEARLRFEREARLAARVKHPNAVGVIDFGEDDGSFFLVMELVPGPSLKEKLRAVQRFTPIDAARIGGRIAAALSAAHRLGLVHRDLKPANVIITPLDGEEQPVVIDFGLAKLFEDDDDGTGITRSNVMVGTPAYMAPEIVKGESIDQRTDLYALGVLLYEMITGQVPLRGKTPVETATKQVIEEAPSLATRADLGVPMALSNLVASLLAKDPALRPRDADAVADVLFAIAGLSRSGRMPAIHIAATATAEDSAVSLQTLPSSAEVASSGVAIVEPATDATVRVPPPLPSARAVEVPESSPARGEPEVAAPSAAALENSVAAQMIARSSTVAPQAAASSSGRLPWVAAAVALGLLGAAAAMAGARRGEPTPDETESSTATPTEAPVTAARAEEADADAVATPEEGSLAPPGALAAPDVAARVAPIAQRRLYAALSGADGAALATQTALVAQSVADVPSHGWLTVTVEPRGEIWLDGERIGETALSRHRLDPGEYTVEARRGEDTVRETIEIEAGEVSRARLRMP